MTGGDALLLSVCFTVSACDSNSTNSGQPDLTTGGTPDLTGIATDLGGAPDQSAAAPDLSAVAEDGGQDLHMPEDLATAPTVDLAADLASRLGNCLRACTRPADCCSGFVTCINQNNRDGGAAYPYNWQCVNGGCLSPSCTSTQECDPGNVCLLVSKSWGCVIPCTYTSTPSRRAPAWSTPTWASTTARASASATAACAPVAPIPSANIPVIRFANSSSRRALGQAAFQQLC
jgi:hypothetical protein